MVNLATKMKKKTLTEGVCGRITSKTSRNNCLGGKITCLHVHINVITPMLFEAAIFMVHCLYPHIPADARTKYS